MDYQSKNHINCNICEKYVVPCKFRKRGNKIFTPTMTVNATNNPE